jgi:hypothetical protein
MRVWVHQVRLFEMLRRKTTALCLCLITLAITICLAGCAGQKEEAKPEAAAQPVKPPPSPITSILPAQQPALNPVAANEPPKPLPLPKPEDVNDVLARAYRKAVAPDTSLEPSFVVGDFNGDGSEDLAIAVKPNDTMLGEINNELANWVLEDPRNISLPGPLSNPEPPASESKPVRANKGDSMLAIIHGVGSQGWRNPEAKQTFLLKNEAANGMTTHTLRSLRTGKDRQKLPPLRGDGIQETVHGKTGLILWTGAKYAWYSGSPG